MKTKFNKFLILLVLIMVQLTYAQERTITGVVSDELGPVSDITVRVDGTDKGTVTNFDGEFAIEAKTGDIIKFTHVTFNDVEKIVGASNTINVNMTESGNILEEVVIIAQGIKKEKKALGYSVSTIKKEAVENVAESDINRVLSGKSAGINITTQNGLSGSSNKVVIRGMNSFTGSNNALYVIDGIPISNDTNENGDFVDGNMGSSRSFDIDPNNIEKVEVLKGLAAATLYGSEGRNGVILITTKTGSTKERDNKLTIQVNSSYFLNKIASLPDYQDQYGGGFNQSFGWFYSNWGPSFNEDGLGGWGSDNVGPPTFNSPFDSDGTIPHPISVSNVLREDLIQEYVGQRYEWKARHSVEEFFRTGITANNSINIRSGSEDGKYKYGFSYSNLEDKGFTPGNKVTRNNLSLNGSAQLSNKFTFSSNLNFVNTNMLTPPVALSFGSSAATTSLFGDIFYTPRSIDFFEIPFEDPFDGSSIYYRQDNAITHPLWTLKNAKFRQITNRVYGSASVNYLLNDNISISYRASLDNYSENNTNHQNKGAASGGNRIQSGFFNSWNNTNTIWDHNIVLSASDYQLSKNIGLGFDLGATSKSIKFDQFGINSDVQNVFGFIDHSNFEIHNQREFHSNRNINGVYAQFSLDYNDYLFLNMSGRKDWVSNINNNSIFYPSASLSFIPTKAFTSLKGKAINYLKLRAGYGTSANFPTGYPTTSLFAINTNLNQDEDGNTIIGHNGDNTLGNPDIKPELLAELEFGAEGRLFKRVNFDFSIYDRKTTDLIVNQPVPPSSGFTNTLTNIGEINIKGVELELGIDVLKNKEAFSWNSSINYTQNKSEVIDLGQDSGLIIYAGFTNLGNGARVGYPLGAMFGTSLARNSEGVPLVNDAGNYVVQNVDDEGLLPYIGDPNPDYIMNFNNTFSYKNLSFNFLINHTSGGDIYSTTIATALGRGLTTDTLDRLGTYVLPGVNQNTGEVNTVQLDNSGYYFDNLFATNANDLLVYDGSVVRLQEIGISYSLPTKLLENTPFGKIYLKISGNNLWYNAYNTPEGVNFDPNVAGLGAGNGQGFEYLTGPSAKRYGMSLNLTF